MTDAEGLARPEILPTHTPTLFAAAVARAAEVLRAGGLVALPTETVYGLAANALDPAAVARIFTAKGRPVHNPIIVHVAGAEMARRCVAQWPPVADRLVAAFWPGPLTLVLPRSAEIPEAVTAGGPTVGVRWPDHPFMQAVIRACGFPLAAPSANPANQLSPTTAAHVAGALGGKVGLIVDGGPSPIGIESTVVDVSVDPPRLLRPGMIHVESIQAVTGALQTDAGGQVEVGPLKSPGQLPRHYSPRARLLVAAWPDEAALRALIAPFNCPPARTFVIAYDRIPAAGGFGGVCVIPHDAEAYGRALYAELHRCDAAGAGLIVVESPPPGPEWRAIADRLRRAAT
jgi:L-threonylcarbamoyladenylate synthase